ncbi:MAG: adenylyl-sulfate kinase, partial [Candidatus Sericytochromatia bacterium]
LAAEREQGITIDVAYRYFATPKRRFIIADTPGHEQYTRNMITGASSAQLAIILVDARNGVLTQSRRHGFLLSLLQIPHLVVAINKMDLVGYSEQAYQQIVEEYARFSEKLEIHDISYVPVSALAGDNVTTRSENMPWYDGPTLLHTLENVEIGADRNLIDFRFPVQYVLRPDQNFRGYAGKVASGQIRPGEEIAVLPSGKVSKIQSIVTYDGELGEAMAGESVVLTLTDEIDISRGDMLVRRHNLPILDKGLDAMLCWLDDAPMARGKFYLLKQTTRTVKAWVDEIHYLIDVNTLARRDAHSFQLNEIGRVALRTAQPLAFDSYRVNHATGSFILIDPDSGHTVAAGMIRGAVRNLEDLDTSDRPARSYVSSNVTRSRTQIPRQDWEKRNGHKAAVLWLTGLSGAGKSTVAGALAEQLFAHFCQLSCLDGDNLRHGLCGDLGFSSRDRSENIRRAGEVAKLFYEQGNLVIATFISPYRADRDFVRSILPPEAFLEVYVQCDLSVCKQRDPKGLYQKAEAGEIPEFTGISSPYEAPLHAEIVLRTDQGSVEDCVQQVITELERRQILLPI